MRDQLFELAPRNVKNQHYESDIRYTILFCQWVLKPIGIWPLINGHATKVEKAISMLLRVACFFALCFVLIPSSLFIFRKETNIFTKVKLFGPVGFCLTSSIKYCYLGIRGRAFEKCIRYVEKDWKLVENPDFRRIMIKNAAIGRNLTLLCAAFLYTGGLSYHTIMPLFSKRTVNNNLTIRPLVYPGYDLFLDPQISPNYEILFCYHCFFAMVTYNITTAACSLAAIFVAHACGQIQIIMLKLQDLVEGKMAKGTNMEDRLKVIVKHHVQVLRFSANVEEVLREICLMELVASTLIICLLEYYCMTEWNNSDAVAIMTYFILLISFTFNIFIFCYIGELLVNQCSELSGACYTINWYDFIGNKGRNLILLIAMSNYPPKLTAGKIFELSFNTFNSVLKSSVVYLNLLRTITE